MRNIKLILSYDGTDFSGWQRQPDRRTVQQVLEEAIGQLTGVMPSTNASGRTDAGVHALGQVVHFHTASRHSPEVFVRALNATLPQDVRVRGAWEMPQAFHATLDAKAKRYRYVIDNGPIADPFQLRYSWHVHRPLDVDGDGPRRAGAAGPARLPQLRDPLAQPDQQRPDDHRHRRRTAMGDSSGSRSRPTDSCTTWCGRSRARSLLVGSGERPESWVGRGPPRRGPREARADRAAAGAVPGPGPLSS